VPARQPKDAQARARTCHALQMRKHGNDHTRQHERKTERRARGSVAQADQTHTPVRTHAPVRANTHTRKHRNVHGQKRRDPNQTGIDKDKKKADPYKPASSKQ